MDFSTTEAVFYGTTEIDAVYFRGETLFQKGVADPIFFTKFIQQSNWFPPYDPGRAYLGDVIHSASIVKPGIVSGRDFTSWKSGARISWPTAILSTLFDGGAIIFGWTPNYTGAPTSDVVLFKIDGSDIVVTHKVNGDLLFEFYDNVAGLIRSATYNLPVVDGVKVRFLINYVFDKGAPSNKLIVEIDDVEVVNDSGFSDITRGAVGSSYISDYITCNSNDEGGKGGSLYIFDVDTGGYGSGFGEGFD